MAGGGKYCSSCEKEIHPVRTKAEFDQAMLESKCVWFDRGTNSPPQEFGMVHLHASEMLPPGAVGGMGPLLPDGKPLVWID